MYAVFWCAICCWLTRAWVAEMTLKTKIQQILLCLTYVFCLWKCWKVKCYFISFVGITTSDKREDFIGRSCFVFVKLIVGYYCSESFCTVWIHKVFGNAVIIFWCILFSQAEKLNCLPHSPDGHRFLTDLFGCHHHYHYPAFTPPCYCTCPSAHFEATVFYFLVMERTSWNPGSLISAKFATSFVTGFVSYLCASLVFGFLW